MCEERGGGQGGPSRVKAGENGNGEAEGSALSSWLVGLCLRGAGKDHHSISVHQAMGTLVPQTTCGAVQGLASPWRKS